MSDEIVRVAGAVLGATLGFAGLVKLARFASWRAAIAAYGLPRAIEGAALPAVPVLELAAAALLLFGPPRAGGALSLGLLAAFSLAVFRGHARHGSRLPCGCFGGAGERDFRAMLARNAALGALAAIVVLGDANKAAVSWPEDAVPLGLTIVGIALGVWMVRGASVMWQRRART
jgi:hypothetical protein